MAQGNHRIVLSLSTVSAACLTVLLSLPRVLEPGLSLSALFPDATAFKVPFALSLALALAAWLIAFLLRHFRALGWHLRLVAVVPCLVLTAASVALYWRT